MKNILFCVLLLFTFQTINAQNAQLTLYVANHKGEIKTVSLGVTECYLIRESSSGDWQNFNGVIEGFKYKEGYNYELSVEKVTAYNPPADLPLYNYKLISIICKKPTMIISSHNKNLLEGSKFVLKRMRFDSGLQKVSDDKMIISLQLKENNVSGFDGCNDFFGKIEINKNKISFSELGGTKKFCPDINTDQIFKTILKEINTYKVSTKYLRFYKGKKLLLEYELIK